MEKKTRRAICADAGSKQSDTTTTRPRHKTTPIYITLFFAEPRSFLTRFFFSLICLRDWVTFSLRPGADDAVLGLELLHGVNVVIDQTKPSGLATTKLRAEAEEADARVVLTSYILASFSRSSDCRWGKGERRRREVSAPCEEGKPPMENSRKTLKD